jgi:hypothetical protein
MRRDEEQAEAQKQPGTVDLAGSNSSSKHERGSGVGGRAQNTNAA